MQDGEQTRAFYSWIAATLCRHVWEHPPPEDEERLLQQRQAEQQRQATQAARALAEEQARVAAVAAAAAAQAAAQAAAGGSGESQATVPIKQGGPACILSEFLPVLPDTPDQMLHLLQLALPAGYIDTQMQVGHGLLDAEPEAETPQRRSTRGTKRPVPLDPSPQQQPAAAAAAPKRPR